MKEQVINIPDNFEIKEIKDGKIILVEKEKKLTYENVARVLFNNCCCYIDNDGSIIDAESLSNHANDSNNCVTRKQAEKLLAINKLMNLAKWLNGDWQPDWSNTKECKYYIYYSNGYKTLNIDSVLSMQNDIIFFKSKELAKQAIDILGEETIKLAFCTDY